MNDPELRRLLDSWWDKNPAVIRSFLEFQPMYERLCSEVEYILRRCLARDGVSFASVSSRVKKLETFVEKAVRKGYKDPIKQTTDLAGVRVVCYLKRDVELVKGIIRKEFDVHKYDEKSGSRTFGYSAEHFDVSISKALGGARYDDLRSLVCEVQVRTIFEDSWAVLEHHFGYKPDTPVSDELQDDLRRLAATMQVLSGTLEKHFGPVPGTSEDLLNNELNVANLASYLKLRFPDLLSFQVFDAIEIALAMFPRNRYPDLRSLDKLVRSSAHERAVIVGVTTGVGQVVIAGGLADAEVLSHPNFPREWKEKIMQLKKRSA